MDVGPLLDNCRWYEKWQISDDLQLAAAEQNNWSFLLLILTYRPRVA